jgi:hypothetical protein
MSAEGYTVLIVEQNIQQVLKVVDRAYLLETGRIRASGHGGRAAGQRQHPPRLSRRLTGTRNPTVDQIFDIFLLEAVLNGLLLGGLLALLALGLNLIFGVIDVVWICYAELIMVGMYAIWWLHSVHGRAADALAFAAAILLVAVRWARPAPVHHPPGAVGRADQPAAGHRRRAVLPAGDSPPWPSGSSSATSACGCPASTSAR